MTESGYYPPGAEHDPNAPWNQVDNPEREIEVTVSVTLSKTVKIKVSDYQITDSGKDEDGEYFEDIDYSDCDLKGAVEEQIVLPQKAWDYIAPKSKKEVQAIFDLKGWNVDDFEVINEKVLESNLQLAGIPHESIDVQSMQGEDIAAKYEIRAVPTLILVDDEGKVVKRHTGLLGIEDLKKFANETD